VPAVSARTDTYAKLRLVDRHLANLEQEQREALEKLTKRFREKFDKLLLQRTELTRSLLGSSPDPVYEDDLGEAGPAKLVDAVPGLIKGTPLKEAE
jgi:hypothetical protein